MTTTLILISEEGKSFEVDFQKLYSSNYLKKYVDQLSTVEDDFFQIDEPAVEVTN
jgi:hypothetical protein